jgi:hypothetical protein
MARPNLDELREREIKGRRQAEWDLLGSLIDEIRGTARLPLLEDLPSDQSFPLLKWWDHLLLESHRPSEWAPSDRDSFAERTEWTVRLESLIRATISIPTPGAPKTEGPLVEMMRKGNGHLRLVPRPDDDDDPGDEAA